MDFSVAAGSELQHAESQREELLSKTPRIFQRIQWSKHQTKQSFYPIISYFIASTAHDRQLRYCLTSSKITDSQISESVLTRICRPCLRSESSRLPFRVHTEPLDAAWGGRTITCEIQRGFRADPDRPGAAPMMPLLTLNSTGRWSQISGESIERLSLN